MHVQAGGYVIIMQHKTLNLLAVIFMLKYLIVDDPLNNLQGLNLLVTVMPPCCCLSICHFQSDRGVQARK